MAETYLVGMIGGTPATVLAGGDRTREPLPPKSRPVTVWWERFALEEPDPAPTVSSSLYNQS